METLRHFAERLTNKVHRVMENHENEMIKNVADLSQISNGSCFQLIRQQYEQSMSGRSAGASGPSR